MIEDVDGVPHKVFASVLCEPVKERNQGKVFRGKRSQNDTRAWHTVDAGTRCACCQSIDFICADALGNGVEEPAKEPVSVFAGKKYKPMGLKVRPVYTELPDRYRIKREIKGDPLAGMPMLNPQPADFVPGARYTTERKEEMEARHAGFLQTEE
ncbi:hypothetical protein B0H19DRAFT_916456, partial [Mycena capillaripes]